MQNFSILVYAVEKTGLSLILVGKPKDRFSRTEA